MSKPAVEQVKASHKLWVQYIDAECTREQFDDMTEDRKNSWLSLFNWI